MTSQRELAEILPDLFPPQGRWDEEDYLWLTDHSNRLIEFTDGYIEVLPMPTRRHQTILGLLYVTFLAHLRSRGGDVLFAPLRLRLPQGHYREPDLLILLDARDPRAQDRYFAWADLVLEVVSADKPERDLVEKRREYAEAGIPEYWIVDPFAETITVLVLGDDPAATVYREHGVFGRGERATSVLLTGFGVDVDAMFDEE
jgi:Uma2 family endonuclease